MPKQFKPSSAEKTETQVIPEIIDSIKYGITNNLFVQAGRAIFNGVRGTDKSGYGDTNREMLGDNPTINVNSCNRAAALINAGASDLLSDDLNQRCLDQKSLK